MPSSSRLSKGRIILWRCCVRRRHAKKCVWKGSQGGLKGYGKDRGRQVKAMEVEERFIYIFEQVRVSDNQAFMAWMSCFVFYPPVPVYGPTNLSSLSALLTSVTTNFAHAVLFALLFLASSFRYDTSHSVWLKQPCQVGPPRPSWSLLRLGNSKTVLYLCFTDSFKTNIRRISRITTLMLSDSAASAIILDRNENTKDSWGLPYFDAGRVTCQLGLQNARQMVEHIRIP